jgi:hypothetical protein
MIVAGPWGRCFEMHIEISLLQEAEKVERIKKSIELGERMMVLAPIGGDANGVF